MLNKIDSICTTFDLIIRGGVLRLDFMKIELIRATFDSIIHSEPTRFRHIIGQCVEKMRLDPAQWRNG